MKTTATENIAIRTNGISSAGSIAAPTCVYSESIIVYHPAVNNPFQSDTLSLSPKLEPPEPVPCEGSQV